MKNKFVKLLSKNTISYVWIAIGATWMIIGPFKSNPSDYQRYVNLPTSLCVILSGIFRNRHNDKSIALEAIEGNIFYILFLITTGIAFIYCLIVLNNRYIWEHSKFILIIFVATYLILVAIEQFQNARKKEKN